MTTTKPSPNVIRIHQCISGFTQTERRMHGVFKLSEELIDLGFNNHISRVSLRPWNSNWDEVAESIWLTGQHHNATVIVNIYAYSWGVGWGAIQLARQLKKRGIDVHRLVSSDGVYRHANPLLRWTSLLGSRFPWSPKIRVPSNVLCVNSFHQNQNRPQGHAIIGDADFSGRIWASIPLQCTHQYMDDADAFHAAAIDAARSLRFVNP